MTLKRPVLFFMPLMLLFVLLVTACSETAGQRNEELPTAAAATADVQEPLEAEEAPESTGVEAVEETAVPELEPSAPIGMEVETPETAAGDGQGAADVDAAEAILTPSPEKQEPVEVLYFTPSQQEGPYYTVDKPADRDNDLVELAGASGLPEGQILQFGGTVYDAAGYPLQGAVVEIWQTDAGGVYLHPNDPGTNGRDRNFQFYGEAVTDANGQYEFRTLLPGLYEPRPRHIHVKVRLDGQEVLTTQFYFAGEIELQGADALMMIDARPGVDEAGNAILVGQRDLFLNVDGRAG